MESVFSRFFRQRDRYWNKRD